MERLNILIADTDRESREFLTDVLNREYHVYCVEDGEQLIDLIEQRERRYHLLLIDLALSKIDGYQVLKYLRKNYLLKKMPVVVLTSDSFNEEMVQAYELGASDYLARPFQEKQILNRIHYVLHVYQTEHRTKLSIPYHNRSKEIPDLKQAEPNPDIQLNNEELKNYIKGYQMIFDVVRILYPNSVCQVLMNERGELEECPHPCYGIWGREERCKNCTTSTAFRTRGDVKKLEICDDDIYQIISKYIEVDGKPYVLELVDKINHSVIRDQGFSESLIDLLKDYNTKIYRDILTGMYNRRYFEEQVPSVPDITAIAEIDVDHFKNINDTYGHAVGDIALQTVAEKAKQSVRKTDMVIRFGGDEFLVLFRTMKEASLKTRLEEIRKSIFNIEIPEYPNLRISASIGGYFCPETFSREMIDRADEAMYEAKKTHNTVAVFSESKE